MRRKTFVFAAIVAALALPNAALAAILERTGAQDGDLVFFGSPIHHVGMYVGDGKMIHAPRTDEAVQITSLLARPYNSEFVGGRRYLP